MDYQGEGSRQRQAEKWRGQFEAGNNTGTCAADLSPSPGILHESESQLMLSLS